MPPIRRLQGRAICLVACFAATAAAGADWKLDGSVSQFFSADSNPGADTTPDGAAVGSSTRLSTALSARTPLTIWTLDSAIGIDFSAGPGADDDQEISSPFVSGTVETGGQRFDATAAVSYTRRSTSFTDVLSFTDDEIELPPGQDRLLVRTDAIETTFRARAGLDYRLTPLLSAIFSVNSEISRYSENDPTLADIDQIGGSFGIRRLIDAASSAGLTLDYSQYSADNLQQTESFTVTGSAFYSTQLTRTLDGSASLGLSYTEVEDEIFPGLLPFRDTESLLGVNANISAEYEGPSGNSFSFLATQAVRPDTDGDVTTVTSLRAAYRGSLTERTSLNVIASHSIGRDARLENEGGDLTQVFALSPSVSYALNRNWTARLGYQFQVRSDEDGTGFNNRVFVGVSRSFNILD